MSKITCIDVSYCQKGVDYKKVKAAGIDAVIIRSGYGRNASQKDSQFETHYKNAKAAGLKVGTYWYSYADSVTAARYEANACLACIEGKTFDLPVYYDLEDGSMTHLGKATLTKMANTFCTVIKKAGYVPGVYANLNWFRNYLDYDSLKASYSIWLAQYAKVNSIKCDIWQNSSSGKIAGISGNVDTDIIYNSGVYSSTTKANTSAKKIATKTTKSVTKVTKPTYKVGKTYKLQDEMKVRNGAGIRYKAKTHSQLTADGQKHDKDNDGCLDKGTSVTCLELKTEGDNIWMRVPSGWIAAFYKNTVYIK